MTSQEARRAAEAARGANGIPPDANLGTMEQRYIELSLDDPSKPGPVRDLLVWAVRFVWGNSWVELAINDADGKVVRVLRSR